MQGTKVEQVFSFRLVNEQPYPNYWIYFNAEHQDRYLRPPLRLETKYQFPLNAFKDRDQQDLLRYQVFSVDAQAGVLQELPRWIKFIPHIRQIEVLPREEQIIGCPADSYSEYLVYKKDRAGRDQPVKKQECLYVVQIQCSDGYSFTHQNIDIKVSNTLPFLYTPIHSEDGLSEADIEVHATSSLDFFFSKETLRDVDPADDLVLYLYLRSGDKIPKWLQFDQEFRRMVISPQRLDLVECNPLWYLEDELTYVNEVQLPGPVARQRCVYPLWLQIFDGCAYASFYFNVTVTNLGPYFNSYIFRKSFEPNIYHIHVSDPLFVVLPSNAFSDRNFNDKLNITYNFTDYTNLSEPWIKYNSI